MRQICQKKQGVEGLLKLKMIVKLIFGSGRNKIADKFKDTEINTGRRFINIRFLIRANFNFII